jgi:DNA-binding transcriptional regulator/RsmH inhibitor MraZ
VVDFVVDIDFGYYSSDVVINRGRFSLPTMFRSATDREQDFVIFCDKANGTLRITTAKLFDIYRKNEMKTSTRSSFNPHKYEPKGDPQWRGNFSAVQMAFLGNPEKVIFTGMDWFIEVKNPNTSSDNKDEIKENIEKADEMMYKHFPKKL